MGKLSMLKILIPTTKERRNRLNECIESIREYTDVPYQLVIYENMDGGWVNACLRGLQGLTGAVIILGDDMLVTENWIKPLLEAYEEMNGEGLVQPDDGIMHGEVATAPLASAEFLSKYLYSGYKHNYADTELKDQAVKLGLYRYVPESKIIHNHWTTGANKDETYLLQDKYFEADRALYESRK